jgi:O-antigen ligase
MSLWIEVISVFVQTVWLAHSRGQTMGAPGGKHAETTESFEQALNTDWIMLGNMFVPMELQLTLQAGYAMAGLGFSARNATDRAGLTDAPQNG